ncbi:helix-turn-helix domain-containing protein [Saccharothrix ecbatanensis]|uniref:helix-turn-helix domain-containing protein n=1 Tax=Saccharothrix ecbatanensis TaxID=1105145 RepID=UPI0035E44D91
MTAAQVEAAVELYQQGWSLMKIARRFDVNDGTVWRKLKAAGVRMRPATNAEWVEEQKTSGFWVLYFLTWHAPCVAGAGS